MHLSKTLSLYFARQFLLSFALVMLALVALVTMFDLVELLRRAAGREQATFAVALQMALFRMPFLSQKILPFAALFAGMLTFSRLTRSHELVVVRAAGVSVWQFLAPAIAVAAAIGVFAMTVFNPLSSVMVKRFEQMEAKYLSGRASLLALSSSGLWLRQSDTYGVSIIHALRMSQRDFELYDVIIFTYEGEDRFEGRIDAVSARLEEGYWDLTDALMTYPDRPAVFRSATRLATDLTREKIQDGFAPPETMSFWLLPSFIRTLEAAGFSAIRHRLHWHSVLAIPALLIAMVLLAATFSLRLTRRGGTGLIIVGGLAAGFVLYFLTDVVLAMGLSGSIPPFLAAWATTGVGILLGASMLLHLEDG